MQLAREKARRWRFVIIACLVQRVVAPPLLAAASAEDLLGQCERSPTDSYCAGYIAGFYDGNSAPNYDNAPESLARLFRYCPPVEESPLPLRLQVTYSQMVRVFIKWGKDNPDKLHLDAWQAVRQAFVDAWPCPPRRKDSRR